MSRIVVVTGSRDWRDISKIHNVLIAVQQEHPEELIYLRQGCASGADAIARSHAEFFGFIVQDYWPDYTSYDFATANKVRNIEMLDKHPKGHDLRAHEVLAFPTPRSRGTWHCVNAAKARKIPVRTFNES